jgi:hypothetical protein
MSNTNVKEVVVVSKETYDELMNYKNAFERDGFSYNFVGNGFQNFVVNKKDEDNILRELQEKVRNAEEYYEKRTSTIYSDYEDYKKSFLNKFKNMSVSDFKKWKKENK